MLRFWYRQYARLVPAEQALEPAIAALGERYRHQHPFFGPKAIADFVLLDRNLIIEVDGDSHDKPSQKKKDLEHTLALKALGYETVRVTNEQALADPEGTVAAALQAKPQTIDQLTSQLEALKRDYPGLFEKKARKRKRRAAKKRGAGRRKQPAS